MNFEEFLRSALMALQSIAMRLVAAAIVLLVGRLVIKFVVNRLKNGKSLKKLDDTVRGFIVAFLNIAMNVLLVVCVVAILGVPTASIIAVIGSVGIAISLAVQGTLGNFASGIMLLVFKPFKKEDFVESGSFSGTVTDIGVFYTTLVTPDNRTIVIPNSALTSSALVNYSTKSTRRLDISTNVAYGTDLALAKSAIDAVIKRHDDILKDPEPFVRMTGMVSTGVGITLRVWCNSENYWNLNFNLLEEIYKEFEEKGIEIPSQKVSVNINK